MHLQMEENNVLVEDIQKEEGRETEIREER